MHKNCGYMSCTACCHTKEYHCLNRWESSYGRPVPMRRFFEQNMADTWFTRNTSGWHLWGKCVFCLFVFTGIHWIWIPKYFFSLYVHLFPFIHIRSSCFVYKCPWKTAIAQWSLHLLVSFILHFLRDLNFLILYFSVYRNHDMTRKIKYTTQIPHKFHFLKWTPVLWSFVDCTHTESSNSRANKL